MEIVVKVGFIGVGEIGGPMAENLLAAGHSVSVFARRPEIAARFADRGASLAATSADVGRGADVVVLCLYTDEQVQEVALEDPALLESMRPGAVLVIHTTGRPGTALTLAVEAARHGVEVLDAPVSGSVEDATEGHITLLVGGDADALERVRPALNCYADPIIHVGPIGHGQATKLVNNALLGVNVRLLAEAARIASSLGVAPDVLLRALNHSSGRSLVVEVAAEMGSIEQMSDFLRPFVEKDVAVVFEIAEEIGLDLGVLERVLRDAPEGRDMPQGRR